MLNTGQVDQKHISKKDNNMSFFLAVHNTTSHPPVLTNGETTGTDSVVGRIIALQRCSHPNTGNLKIFCLAWQKGPCWCNTSDYKMGRASYIFQVGPTSTHGPLNRRIFSTRVQGEWLQIEFCSLAL